MSVKRADPISLDNECALWNSGVMYISTSRGLSYAVFFHNSKTFGLRGNAEYKNLDASQFTVVCSDEGSYIFFNAWNTKCLTVDAVLFPVALSSAITVLRHVCSEFFRLYLSMIPLSGPFYRKPLVSSFTFEAQCVGISKLPVYTKTTYAGAGTDSSDRHIVNHSECVRCCTWLYNAGFDEQSVTDRSGHRSNAVQIYKRPCVEQQKAVSNALDVPNIGSTRGLLLMLALRLKHIMRLITKMLSCRQKTMIVCVLCCLRVLVL